MQMSRNQVYRGQTLLGWSVWKTYIPSQVMFCVPSLNRVLVHVICGKSQRADATWKRKWRSYCKPTELIPKQVIGHEHKVEPEHHPRKDISLHMIAQLTLCRLKVQLMGPAVRKQRRPLACWMYSRTSTHGILQQQDSRDWRCAEHRPGLHVNISN